MAIRSLTIGCKDSDLRHSEKSIHIASCSPFDIEMWEEGSGNSSIISVHDLIAALNALEVDYGKPST